MTDKKELIIALDDMIRRSILRGRNFVRYSAVARGIARLETKNWYDKIAQSEDFEYFAFTKSTKTMDAIRKLIKAGLNEDAFILVRAIFENYLNARFVIQNWEVELQNFIEHPIGVDMGIYDIRKDGEFIDKKTGAILGQRTPISKLVLGQEKKYYHRLYDFLCSFTHCNFAIKECYMDQFYYQFDYQRVNYEVEVRTFALFSFVKLFEIIVTIEGEEFKDAREEDECYKFVEDAKQVLGQAFSYLESLYNEYIKISQYPDVIRSRRKMISSMRKSLSEKLGSSNPCP